MSTEVWYRKWRPQCFGDVAGQDHVTRTLANAVANNRVAHAYLFCGPRGTGKTSTARILAKAANCRSNRGGEPCNECANCRAVADGRALDLVEMDAASNRGIDEIRSLRDKVGYSPTSSRYKVYLIDEVHELTAHAFDALLKTLEEPPPHVIFVLATTEADRVPATVASRCQRYDFRRIRLQDVVGRLEQVCAGEGVELPAGAGGLIARKATGSLRDAVNLLEQVVAACGPSPTLEQAEQALGIGGEALAATLVRHVLATDLALAFGAIAAARDEGIEPRQIQRAALDYLRSLLLVKSDAEATLELGEEALHDLRETADQCEMAVVLRLIRSLSAVTFRGDALSPLPLELAIAEVALLPTPEPVSAGLGATPMAAVSTAPKAALAAPASRSLQPAPVRRSAPSGAPDAAPATPLAREISPEPIPLPPRPFPQSTGQTNAGARSAEATPVPVPAPEPPVSAQAKSHGDRAGGATLAELQGMMATVYERLAAQKSRARFFVNSECNIMAVEGDEVTLGFAQDFIAAKFKSDGSGNNISDLEDALEALSGQRYHLRVQVDPDVKGWRRPPATAKTSHLLDEAEKLGLRRAEP